MDKLLIYLLLGTGARIAEVINIKPKDINLRKSSITLTKTKNK